MYVPIGLYFICNVDGLNLKLSESELELAVASSDYLWVDRKQLSLEVPGESGGGGSRESYQSAEGHGDVGLWPRRLGLINPNLSALRTTNTSTSHFHSHFRNRSEAPPVPKAGNRLNEKQRLAVD